MGPFFWSPSLSSGPGELDIQWTGLTNENWVPQPFLHPLPQCSHLHPTKDRDSSVSESPTISWVTMSTPGMRGQGVLHTVNSCGAEHNSNNLHLSHISWLFSTYLHPLRAASLSRGGPLLEHATTLGLQGRRGLFSLYLVFQKAFAFCLKYSYDLIPWVVHSEERGILALDQL